MKNLFIITSFLILALYTIEILSAHCEYCGTRQDCEVFAPAFVGQISSPIALPMLSDRLNDHKRFAYWNEDKEKAVYEVAMQQYIPKGSSIACSSSETSSAEAEQEPQISMTLTNRKVKRWGSHGNPPKSQHILYGIHTRQGDFYYHLEGNNKKCTSPWDHTTLADIYGASATYVYK